MLIYFRLKKIIAPRVGVKYEDAVDAFFYQYYETVLTDSETFGKHYLICNDRWINY